MTCTNMILCTGCSTVQGHNMKHPSHKPLPGDRAGPRVANMESITVAPDNSRAGHGLDNSRAGHGPDNSRAGQHLILGTLSVPFTTQTNVFGCSVTIQSMSTYPSVWHKHTDCTM